MDKNILEILAFIGSSSTGVSFYQIVRGFGFPDAPYNLKEVLHLFIEQGLIELSQSEAGVNARYTITSAGIAAMSK